MPSFRPLPQELVDKIIDQLGEDYWDLDQCFEDRIGVVRQALHACTLVSKNWTGRSRAQLFKEVNLRADGGGSFPIPPGAIMPYITKLGVRLQYIVFSRLSPAQDLLTPFYACPIAYLGITKGAFTITQIHLIEFVTTVSATLQTVVFKECSVSLRLIHDIMLAHPDLEQLHLYGCEIESEESDRPTTPHLGSLHPTDLELGFFALGSETHIRSIVAVAQLPIKCCRLNFDYKQRPDMIPSANALIEATAESLSSLTVRFLTWNFQPGNDPVLCLERCFNLSELTLHTERGVFYPVPAFANILSTLSPRQHTHLEWIRLTTKCLYDWSDEDSRSRFPPEWSNLDTPLSELAKVTICTKGKKLTFVLTTICNGNCIPFGRERFPELLPRFHGLGEFRAENEGNPYTSCLRDRYERDLLEEGK